MKLLRLIARLFNSDPPASGTHPDEAANPNKIPPDGIDNSEVPKATE